MSRTPTVPMFTVHHPFPRAPRTTSDLGRSDLTLTNGEPAVMRCDAIRCGRSAPKYQVAGVWKESLARAAPGALLEFLLANSRKVAPD